jgi:hypothetical protein
MIESVQEDVYRLDANTPSFYIKDCTSMHFGIHGGSWNLSPENAKELYFIHICNNSNNIFCNSMPNPIPKALLQGRLCQFPCFTVGETE